jgi:hemerythrin
MTYAGLHFAAEESLMERHEFPGLSTHRVQHEMFRNKMMAFLEKHRAAKPGVSLELLLFLQTWLKTHVLKTDKQYSAF